MVNAEVVAASAATYAAPTPLASQEGIVLVVRNSVGRCETSVSTRSSSSLFLAGLADTGSLRRKELGLS